MRFASRVAVAAALVFAPLSGAVAQNAGKTLAMDFRMTSSVQGTPDTGVIVGHAVGTADKMRLDLSMKGAGAKVTPIADSTVSMIVTDSGKTITYLDSKKSVSSREAGRDGCAGPADGRHEDGFLGDVRQS